MSTSASILQDVASVDDFLNVEAIETVPLFEHLEFEFLREYDVFAVDTPVWMLGDSAYDILILIFRLIDVM